ncbi:MAG: hypothetical protein FWG68_10115 [Defluviitaleaceae bacterium]|nr:hypothetical protein [Defluviitaleaceae bacterium]
MQEKIYNLFGKQYCPTNGLLAYNDVHQFIQNKASKGQTSFNEKYEKFNDIEQLLAGGEPTYERIIQKIAEGFAKRLEYAGISGFDTESFRQFHETNHANLLKFTGIIEDLKDQYEEIIEDEAEKNAYRTERRQKRYRIKTGGSGEDEDNDNDDDSDEEWKEALATAGNVAGTVAAGAFNAASGLAHGTVNVVGKIGSSINAKVKKTAMFKNPELFPALSKAVYGDCFGLHVSFLEIMQKNGVDIISGIAEKDAKQAEAMFSKLPKSAPQAETLDNIIKILALNPYKPQYYEYLVEMFQDKNNEVEILAEDFGYLADVRKFKRGLADKYFREMPKTSIAETVKSAAELDEYCNQLSISNSFAETLQSHMFRLAGNYFIQLANGAKSLKIAENDTEGVVLIKAQKAAAGFDSIESCKAAMAELADYCAPMGDVPNILAETLDEKLQECKIKAANEFLLTAMTNAEIGTAVDELQAEERLLAVETELLAYCAEIELPREENPAWDKVDKLIRTVEGYELATREISHKARQEKIEIEGIAANIGKTFRGDFLAILAEINSGRFTTAIKGHYEKMYTQLLKEFDKKLDKARHYENQKNTGKKFTGFRNILKDVSSALGSKSGENAWNELTQNGKYTLGLIAADSISSKTTLVYIPPSSNGEPPNGEISPSNDKPILLDKEDRED